MSTSISSVGRLVTIIRAELSNVTAQVPAPALAGQRAATRSRGSRYAESNLAGLIALRVREIGRDDPQRGRKAFRIFLEVVLLSTLGERMVTDPKFHQLVDDVQRAMESQDACAQLVDEAVGQLLAQKG